MKVIQWLIIKKKKKVGLSIWVLTQLCKSPKWKSSIVCPIAQYHFYTAILNKPYCNHKLLSLISSFLGKVVHVLVKKENKERNTLLSFIYIYIYIYYWWVSFIHDPTTLINPERTPHLIASNQDRPIEKWPKIEGWEPSMERCGFSNWGPWFLLHQTTISSHRHKSWDSTLPLNERNKRSFASSYIFLSFTK